MDTEIRPAVRQYSGVELTDVVFFMRPDTLIPLAKPAQCTQDIDFEHLELLKFVQNEMASYEYYHYD